jgi:L-fuculose-phosphate aldolase
VEICRAWPDVQAIVHAHQLMATCFGVAERPILPILHVEAPVLADGIAVYPSPQLVTTPERGREMVQALGQHHVMHLQGHGIVTAEKTIEEATLAAINLERLANATYIAQSLGAPRVISPEGIAQLQAELAPPQGRWAYYSSLVEEPE